MAEDNGLELKVAYADLFSRSQKNKTAIEDEAKARSKAVSDEATARSIADSALDGRITTLSQSLTDEADARATADTNLGNRITNLSTALTTETTNRENADTTLQNNINSEADARSTSDISLQSQIDTVKTKLDNAPSISIVDNGTGDYISDITASNHVLTLSRSSPPSVSVSDTQNATTYPYVSGISIDKSNPHKIVITRKEAPTPPTIPTLSVTPTNPVKDGSSYVPTVPYLKSLSASDHAISIGVGDLEAYVDSKMSTFQQDTKLYRVKGSITNAGLAALTDKKAGDVYNITDNGTFNKGANVVWTGTEWDSMSGVDLGTYIKSITPSLTTGTTIATFEKYDGTTGILKVPQIPDIPTKSVVDINYTDLTSTMTNIVDVGEFTYKSYENGSWIDKSISIKIPRDNTTNAETEGSNITVETDSLHNLGNGVSKIVQNTDGDIVVSYDSFISDAHIYIDNTDKGSIVQKSNGSNLMDEVGLNLSSEFKVVNGTVALTNPFTQSDKSKLDGLGTVTYTSNFGDGTIAGTLNVGSIAYSIYIPTVSEPEKTDTAYDDYAFDSAHLISGGFE